MMTYLGSRFIFSCETVDSPYFGEHGSIPKSETNGEYPLTEGAHDAKHSFRHKLTIKAYEKHGDETHNVSYEHQRICHRVRELDYSGRN